MYLPERGERIAEILLQIKTVKTPCEHEPEKREHLSEYGKRFASITATTEMIEQ